MYMFVDDAEGRLYGVVLDRDGKSKPFSVLTDTSGDLLKNTLKVGSLSEVSPDASHMIVYSDIDGLYEVHDLWKCTQAHTVRKARQLWGERKSFSWGTGGDSSSNDEAEASVEEEEEVEIESQTEPSNVGDDHDEEPQAYDEDDIGNFRPAFDCPREAAYAAVTPAAQVYVLRSSGQQVSVRLSDQYPKCYLNYYINSVTRVDEDGQTQTVPPETYDQFLLADNSTKSFIFEYPDGDLLGLTSDSDEGVDYTITYTAVGPSYKTPTGWVNRFTSQTVMYDPVSFVLTLKNPCFEQDLVADFVEFEMPVVSEYAPGTTNYNIFSITTPSFNEDLCPEGFKFEIFGAPYVEGQAFEYEKLTDSSTPAAIVDTGDSNSVAFSFFLEAEPPYEFFSLVFVALTNEGEAPLIRRRLQDDIPFDDVNADDPYATSSVIRIIDECLNPEIVIDSIIYESPIYYDQVP